MKFTKSSSSGKEYITTLLIYRYHAIKKNVVCNNYTTSISRYYTYFTFISEHFCLFLFRKDFLNQGCHHKKEKSMLF